MIRIAVKCGFAACLIAATVAAPAIAAPAAGESRVESSNMKLAGYSDLQARTAYQPVIQRQGDRWIAYIGHHGDNKLNPLNGKMEENGTSIVDVTDVKKPKYLAHVPGDVGKAEQGGAQMVRICSGDDLQHAVGVGAVAEVDAVALGAGGHRTVQFGRHGTGRAWLLACQAEVADEDRPRRVAQIVDLRHAARAPVG